MQPEQPSPPPSAPLPQPPMPDTTQRTQPDYSFLTQQPHKTSRLKIPFIGNTLIGRAVVLVVVLVLVVIMLIIIKNLVTSPPFSKTDYLALVERQQEILHILSTDVTPTNLALLSISDQNFTYTTKLSLESAQDQTLVLMKDYGDKINVNKLSTIYSADVDDEFTDSLSTNTFDSVFKSEMQLQLEDYMQELKAAYATTTVSPCKSSLRSYYSDAKLLLAALNSPTS